MFIDEPFAPVCTFVLETHQLAELGPHGRTRLQQYAAQLLLPPDVIGEVKIAAGAKPGFEVTEGLVLHGADRLRTRAEYVLEVLRALMAMPASMPLDTTLRCWLPTMRLSDAVRRRMHEVVRLEVTRMVVERVGLLVDVHCASGARLLEVERGRLAVSARVEGDIAEAAAGMLDEYEQLLNAPPAHRQPHHLFRTADLALTFFEALATERGFHEIAAKLLNAIPRRFGFIRPIDLDLGLLESEVRSASRT